jgi:hypothetical protein
MRFAALSLAVALAALQTTLALAGSGGSDGDPVAVPEPTSLAIIASGIVAAALIRNRLRR